MPIRLGFFLFYADFCFMHGLLVTKITIFDHSCITMATPPSIALVAIALSIKYFTFSLSPCL